MSEEERIIKVTPETAKEWNNLLPIEYRVGLNAHLIAKQELDRPDVGLVFDMHGQKLVLFQEMQELLMEFAFAGKITPEDQETIETYNQVLEELEFSAQRAWKFPPSVDHHNWQFDVPGCRCPQMDNRERMGVPGFIYNGDCVWHGQFDSSKTEI